MKTFFEWEIEVPVMKNPLLLFQTALVVGIGATFVFLLLLGLNLYERAWGQIADSFVVWISLFLGLGLLFTIALLLISAGGKMIRYEVDDKGIVRYDMRKKGGVSKWLGILGLFSGTSAGYTAAGAALLSNARKVEATRWRDVSRIETFPLRREIRLSNDWRTLMQIFCPQDRYDDILKLVRTNVDEKEKDRETLPLAHRVVFSFFALLFGFFLLPKLPIEVSPLPVLLLLLSAQAALWSGGKKRRIASIVTMALAIGLPLASAGMNGVHLGREGAWYALGVELLCYFYFVFVAWRV